ncbi:MAG: nucleotidyltransferase [Nitrososphaera sp.]|nr:nucleotidyltransferase [Nitrososphaera sp.]
MQSSTKLLTRSLVKLQTRLEAQGISSALLGGLTLAVWARPRVTKDVDVKILLTREEADKLLSALGPAYQSLHPDPKKALQHQGVLFVRDSDGIRIDLMLADTTFDQQAIQRAKMIELQEGMWAKVITPEDLIIYKLISTRKQDQVDVEQVIRVQAKNLDDAYIRKWLKQFEEALDDSTLLASYLEMRKRFRTK